MEVFRDLYVSADAARMATAVDEMERALPSGWTRDRAAEDRSRSFPGKGRPAYSYTCTGEGRRAAATLVLAQKDPGTFYVSNIIPVSRHQLSHSEYNAVLEEFYERALRPYAERSGLFAKLTGDRARLESWMSAATVEKLRQFSACANKGTGSANPPDRERWSDFDLSAHRESSRMDAATLSRWLVEVEGWLPDVADQLALEYEFGRELLTFAEGHCRSA